MATLRDDLIAAKALIDTPEKWTKGIDYTRCRLCAMYALSKAILGSDRYAAASAALIKAVPASSQKMLLHPVVAFNDADATTHADIMALFDRAIAAA